MAETGFWLIRHAIVSENARAILYGAMDVELCPTSLVEQRPMYEALARRLPAIGQLGRDAAVPHPAHRPGHFRGRLPGSAARGGARAHGAASG